MSKVMYEKEQIDKVLVLLDQVRVEGLQSFLKHDACGNDSS